MRRVKKRTFSGVVCEQEVYDIPDRIKDVRNARPPRPRFKTEEEREQHRIGISRRKHTRLVNSNFTHNSLYSTLTLSNQFEVHTFEEAEKIRKNFMKRIKRKFPDARMMIYMGRGKSTHRIHFHILSDGVPEEAIRQKWNLGNIIRIDHLKEHNYYDGIDCGEDYTGLANYLFDHWTPEQGRKRWSATQNLIKPEEEAPKEIKREYTETKAPLAPKGYILVESKSTKYGYLYFKYVKKPPKKSRKNKL
ncbi:uncharacterized protein BN513_00410 [Clostridium sp. CAG:169]|nr:uncharacterized protein BN513_00410 [Clostridium sp. CAG:169]